MTPMSTYRIDGATGVWEVVIGLEVHAQVVSNSKLFSGAGASFGPCPALPNGGINQPNDTAAVDFTLQ